MDNEKFQEIVLKELKALKTNVNSLTSNVNNLDSRFDGLESRFDGMETKFNGLETKFIGMENRFDSLETRFDGLESRFDGLELNVKELSHKMEAVYEQTAILTEFRTETNNKLENISNCVEYLMYKDNQTEKEIFTLKKNISLVKE